MCVWWGWGCVYSGEDGDLCGGEDGDVCMVRMGMFVG